MKKFLLLIFLQVFIQNCLAQFINTTVDSLWYKYKKEIYIGFGGTQFLGDLGGSDGPGKKFGMGDIDWLATSWQVHTGFRYHFHPLFATSSSIYFGIYNASDYYANYEQRAKRKIDIRSTIIDLSQRFEFIFYSKYEQKMKNEKTKFMRFEAYVYSGIGVCYFNPQAGRNSRLWEGTFLRPLHTEGQTYPNGPKEYSRITATIPFGFGVQKSISRKRSLKFELSYIKTFSDYMDDTSGKYYSYQANQTTASIDQIYFSNPSEDWTTFKNGDPRGGKGKDCYFYASFSYVKTLGLRLKKNKK